MLKKIKLLTFSILLVSTFANAQSNIKYQVLEVSLNKRVIASISSDRQIYIVGSDEDFNTLIKSSDIKDLSVYLLLKEIKSLRESRENLNSYIVPTSDLVYHGIIESCSITNIP